MQNHFRGGIIILLLFFLGFDFFGIGHYITFILLPYILIKSKANQFIDKESLWLLSFSTLYVLILFCYPLLWAKFGIGKMISYLFLPFAAYLSGKYIIAKNYQNNNNIYLLLLLLALAEGILPIISVLNDIYVHGFLEGSRNIMLLNGLSIERNATGINGYIIIIASFFGLLFFSAEEKKVVFYKWLFISLSIVSIFCMLRIASRTGVFVILMSLIVVFRYNLKRKYLLFYFFTLILLVFLASNFLSLSSPVFSYLEMRTNEGNLDTMGSRLPLWNYYFSHLLDYPFGNVPNIFTYTQYAHNLWLDVSRLTGIIPFILLLIFTFLALRIFFRFIKNSNIPSLFRNVILIWQVAIYSVFFVEPIIEGLFSLFIVYCFLVGMLKQSNTLSLQRKKRRIKISKNE